MRSQAAVRSHDTPLRSARGNHQAVRCRLDQPRNVLANLPRLAHALSRHSAVQLMYINMSHACAAAQDMQEAPAAGITAQDEVWENERYIFLKGWTSPGLMPQDVAARKRRFKHGGEGFDSFPTLRCPAGGGLHGRTMLKAMSSSTN